MVQKKKENKDMCIERKEIIEILDDKLGTVNNKLDNIVRQTTKTNSRVDKLEDEVKDIRIEDAGRFESCPQQPNIEILNETMNTVKQNLISQKQMRNLMLKAITIAGIFFTVLFGLIALILRWSGGILPAA